MRRYALPGATLSTSLANAEPKQVGGGGLFDKH
jgi:hypothetical protein